MQLEEICQSKGSPRKVTFLEACLHGLGSGQLTLKGLERPRAEQGNSTRKVQAQSSIASGHKANATETERSTGKTRQRSATDCFTWRERARRSRGNISEACQRGMGNVTLDSRGSIGELRECGVVVNAVRNKRMSRVQWCTCI